MNYRKRGVYVKLYASYILILLVPLLIGGIVYVKILEISREQASRLNSSLMQIVKNECDNQVDEAMKNLNRIILDTRVQMLSSVRKQFDAKNRYDMYSLYTDLKNSNFSAGYYKDVFVYFKNTDTVISTSGNMSLEMFCYLYDEDGSMALETMREYLAGFHVQKITPVSLSGGSKEILYTMTSLNSNLGEESATIGIRMDVDALDERIASVKWDDRMEFLIIDGQNRVMNTVRPDLLTPKMSYGLLEEQDGLEYEINGTDYIGKAVESEAADWKYLLLTPVEVVEQNARQIRQFCMAALFLCMFLSFLISHYLAKVNYNPLKLLVDMFKGQRHEEPDRENVNEYQWLENQVQQLFQEHSDIKHNLTANQKILKQYYFFRLLEYPLEEVGEVSGAREYVRYLTAPYNLVLLFFGVKADQESSWTAGEAAFRRFVMMNIAGEMLAEQFNVEMVEIGEMAAAVINLPGEQEEYLNVIRECGENARKIICGQFEFHIAMAVGAPHKGLEGVHTSYLEAREAEEYINILDTDTILYRDIKNANKKYYYPMEMESKIINAIKAGDSRQAMKYVGEVLDVNYCENKVSSRVLKCLLYDMMGTVMKGADETGCAGFLDGEGVDVAISVKRSPEETKNQFKSIIDGLCQELERKKGSSDNQLSEKIREYIRTQYRDPDINISQTGFYFDMTPAYISTVFKKQTGKSLLKYINSVRVDAARELLEQGTSVVETSQLVGFRDSRTFIRVFKEYTGITPGQMKKIVH